MSELLRMVQDVRGGEKELSRKRASLINRETTLRSGETVARGGGVGRQKRAASKELQTHRMFQLGRGRAQPHLLALRNVEHETKTTLHWEGLQGEVGHRETS